MPIQDTAYWLDSIDTKRVCGFKAQSLFEKPKTFQIRDTEGLSLCASSDHIASILLPMKRTKPLKRLSTKRAREMREYRNLKETFFLEYARCFRCNEHVPYMHRELHHFYGRIGALLCWVPGFRMVCRDCHRYIETHRVHATTLGLRASEELFNRPSLVIPK